MVAKILIRSFLRPAGLANKGNTCFFNATMQCLLSLPEFISFLKRNEFSMKRQPVSHALRAFVFDYQNNKVCDPQDFIRSISAKIQLFDGKQQDAQCFLDGLLTHVIDEQGEKAGQLREMFEMQNMDTVNCKNCSYTNVTRARSVLLCLDLADSVKDALANYVDHDAVMDPRASWKCPDCQKGLVKPRHGIEKPSEFVVILLNRFLNAYSKNNTRIHIEPEIELGGRCYQSIGVVCHVGDLRSGHYFSKCRRDGVWYEFNDASVTESAATFGAEQPYILFYALKKEEADV